MDGNGKVEIRFREIQNIILVKSRKMDYNNGKGLSRDA